MRVHLKVKSGNLKTGPIPVSTTSAETCPATCPFNSRNEGGCYAAGGPLALHWRRVTAGERGDEWDTFCSKIAALPDGQLWRHNQAGDLPGDGETIDGDKLAALVRANKGRRGFTYTHYPVENHADNARHVADANKAGLTVNLSGNNLAHADALADLGIAPVVTVLPAEDAGKRTVQTPAGRVVTVCPATYREKVSCASCKLCAVRDRKVIVGFPAHGASKRKASAVAARLERVRYQRRALERRGYIGDAG